MKTLYAKGGVKTEIIPDSQTTTADENKKKNWNQFCAQDGSKICQATISNGLS